MHLRHNQLFNYSVINMRSTFKILFYLNTSKRKKSGLCPVMVRITVDGSVAQISLKEDAHSDRWDSKIGRATGKTREQITLNKKINKTEQTIKDIYVRIIDSAGYVTAEQIKNDLTGAVHKAETLLKLLEEHNLEFEKRVGIDKAESSFHTFKISYNHLSRFIRSKYELEDYPLHKLDKSFIDNFDFYLRVDANMAVSTMLNHIFILKKMVARAINQGTIKKNPFSEYVPEKLKLEYKHLSGEELNKIMSAQIDDIKFRFIRDMFVFSCFTGLAYADICLLSEKHLQKTSDGKIRIEIPRKKTQVYSCVKLLDIPSKIIEKYRYERKSDRLFNMPKHNVIINYMRKLEKLCGINHLHFHMARHTFATLICLTNGVPLETISKMMGHSSMHSTQIYAEITSQKVSMDMKKIAGRIKEKYSCQ